MQKVFILNWAKVAGHSGGVAGKPGKKDVAGDSCDWYRFV